MNTDFLFNNFVYLLVPGSECIILLIQLYLETFSCAKIIIIKLRNKMYIFLIVRKLKEQYLTVETSELTSTILQ